MQRMIVEGAACDHGIRIVRIPLSVGPVRTIRKGLVFVIVFQDSWAAIRLSSFEIEPHDFEAVVHTRYE
jgi:hypothetical protein